MEIHREPDTVLFPDAIARAWEGSNRRASSPAADPSTRKRGRRLFSRPLGSRYARLSGRTDRRSMGPEEELAMPPALHYPPQGVSAPFSPVLSREIADRCLCPSPSPRFRLLPAFPRRSTRRALSARTPPPQSQQACPRHPGRFAALSPPLRRRHAFPTALLLPQQRHRKMPFPLDPMKQPPSNPIPHRAQPGIRLKPDPGSGSARTPRFLVLLREKVQVE